MPSAKSSGKPGKKSPPQRRTITLSELRRLSFCNSDKLPQTVQAMGRRKQWVGIGWVDEGPSDGKEEAILVYDEPPPFRLTRKTTAGGLPNYETPDGDWSVWQEPHPPRRWYVNQEGMDETEIADGFPTKRQAVIWLKERLAILSRGE